jgi:hypothetical protein
MVAPNDTFSLCYKRSAIELKAFRKRLETAKLNRRETPIGPVEGTDGRTWLGLDSPGRSVLGKLEQEAPITGAPSEEGHAGASARASFVGRIVGCAFL